MTISPRTGHMLALALDAHAAAPAAATAVAVWHQLERVRARALGERLAGGERTEESDADAVVARRRFTGSTAAWSGSRTRASRPRPCWKRCIAPSMSCSNRRAASASCAHWRRPTPTGAPARDTWLADGDALVEYGVRDDELFACVVTRTDVRLVRGLADGARCSRPCSRGASRSRRCAMARPPCRPTCRAWPARAAAPGAPARAAVGTAGGAGATGAASAGRPPRCRSGSVPFAALHDGTTYLGDRHRLALAPSARRSAAPGSASNGAPHTARSCSGDAAGCRMPGGRHASWPGCLPRRDCCVDEQATLDALRAGAGHADVVHLACHAQFRATTRCSRPCTCTTARSRSRPPSRLSSKPASWC